MIRIILIGILAAAPCWAQDSTPVPQQPPAQVQAQSGSNTEGQSLTIPAATRVPMKLTSPINSKSRPGDPVRASIAFPVTVDTQMAIPVGTYAEGVIEKISKHGPTVQMHFTRVVYSNGYTVSLDAINALAQVRKPVEISTPISASANVNVAASDLTAFETASGPMPDATAFTSENDAAPDPAMNLQQQPPPTQPAPLPHVGPSTGLIVGIAVASAAAIVATILIGHHHGGSNYVLFDTSWQFDLVLQSPLTLDATKVAAAISATPGQ